MPPPRQCPGCGKDLVGKRDFCDEKCNAAYRLQLVKDGIVKPFRVDFCPICKTGEIPRFKGYSKSMRQQTCGSRACVTEAKKQARAYTAKNKRKPGEVPANPSLIHLIHAVQKPFRLTYCNQNGCCASYRLCSDSPNSKWRRELGEDCFKEDFFRGQTFAGLDCAVDRS